MDNEKFRNTLLGLVGSYKAIGDMLAYEIDYDSDYPKNTHIMGLTRADFADVFIDKIFKNYILSRLSCNSLN